MRLKALLLGSQGQLGHDLRRAHAESGGASFELMSLARESLDLADSGSVERVLSGLDFDVLVNCAAHTRVDDAEDNASPAFAVNAHAVQTMSRVCAAKGVRLFHVSTDYVFGGDRAREAPLHECDPIAPVNIYGASKAMGETLARLESDDVVILRVASLFGAAGSGGRGGNFVETVVRAAREKRQLRVVDDQAMSPTAATDVARIAMRMLTEGCAAGVYHVVNTGSATWHEFACEILRRAGFGAGVARCATGEYPVRAMRPRYCVLDNAKVSAEFGALPPWQDALERYLRSRGHIMARSVTSAGATAREAP